MYISNNIFFVDDLEKATTGVKIVVTVAGVAIKASAVGTTAVIIGTGVGAAVLLIGGAIAYNIINSKKDDD